MSPVPYVGFSAGRAAVVCGLLAALALPAAVLQGVVLDHLSGRPLARAVVMVSGLSGGFSQRVFASAQGQFVFSDVPAGAYTVSATRPYFAPGAFGQTGFDSPGSPIVLTADASFMAEIRLRRLGVVSGQVLDENGVGFPSVPVYAYRAGRRPRLVTKGETDDRGHYRLPGLEPGRHLIRTGAREVEPRHGLLPTYLGRVMRMSDAVRVTARLEDDVLVPSIEPMPGRLSTLSGDLLPAVGGTVTLFTDVGSRQVHLKPDERFRFDQLPPGTYEIVAEATVAGAPYVGYQLVTVGRELESIQLDLHPSSSVVLRCQGVSGPLTLTVRRRVVGDQPPAKLACNGVTRLAPGMWEVVPESISTHHLVRLSASRRSEEGLLIFSLLPRQSGFLEATFEAGSAALQGVVRSVEGRAVAHAPVFLRGTAPDLPARLGGIRMTRTGATGEFGFDGLPPGEYEVVSSFDFRHPDDSEWDQGTAGVQVQVGATARVEVTIRPGVGVP